MIECRYKISRIVFQYVIVGYVVLSVLYSGNALAQSVNEFQWSKSAKSLTIFQPGDAVRIQVWELYHEETGRLGLGGDYSINPQGFIIMPIIGEVKVRGLTIFEVMQTLETKLKAYLRNPYVYVRPLIRVTMQGAFNRPGAYLVDPSSSLWHLVALAGGPDSRCNLRRIRVERGGKTITEKVLDSFEKGVSLEEVGIESGDQIYAPARGGINLAVIIGMVNLFASILLLYLRIRTGGWY